MPVSCFKTVCASGHSACVREPTSLYVTELSKPRDVDACGAINYVVKANAKTPIEKPKRKADTLSTTQNTHGHFVLV